MSDAYSTIAGPAETEIKVKASRFIGSISRVESIEASENFLASIKKRYHDARHHCYAYLINEKEFRYNDDGEPNQSAGKPIFDVIHGSGLKEIMIVVTRYFGGTKLGVGGLVRAYSEAALAVLELVDRIEIIQTHRYQINYGYDDTSIVMHELEKVAGKIIDNHYGDAATIKVDVRQSKGDDFQNDLIEASHGRIQIEMI